MKDVQTTKAPPQTYSDVLKSVPQEPAPSTSQSSSNDNNPQLTASKCKDNSSVQREQKSISKTQKANEPRMDERERLMRNEQEEQTRSTEDRHHHQKESETKCEETPYHKLAKHKVASNTQRIIIGDSVMTRIDPNVAFDSDKANQSIAISGMKLSDLLQWLRNVPPNPQIQQIVIHIGINTCKEGEEITKDGWCNLITKIRRVFNGAEIFISSIIPPSKIRVQADLLNLVNKSNENLKMACKSKNVYLIDNNQLFTTSRGLPRKAMYYDTIHPSPKGTDALISNICKSVLPPKSQSGSQEMAYFKKSHVHWRDSNPAGFNGLGNQQHFHRNYEDRFADHGNSYFPQHDGYRRPSGNYRADVNREAYSIDNTGYQWTSDNSVNYASHASPSQRHQPNYNPHEYARQPYEVNEMHHGPQLTSRRRHVQRRAPLSSQPRPLLPFNHFNPHQRQRSPFYFNDRYS